MENAERLLCSWLSVTHGHDPIMVVNFFAANLPYDISRSRVQHCRVANSNSVDMLRLPHRVY